MSDSDQAYCELEEEDGISAECSQPDEECKPATDKKKKPIQSGVVYLETIPQNMGANRIRETFVVYGKVTRVFLQPEKHRTQDGRKVRKYVEGWIEFADKRIAKRVAASFNNTPVGGKRRSAAADCMWVMKYLSRFKWHHLQEQLDYERAVHKQRLLAEIGQAKRQANYFASQVEKGSRLAELEERILKKGGKWEKYQRQLHQKKPTNVKKEDSSKVLSMVFQK